MTQSGGFDGDGPGGAPEKLWHDYPAGKSDPAPSHTPAVVLQGKSIKENEVMLAQAQDPDSLGSNIPTATATVTATKTATKTPTQTPTPTPKAKLTVTVTPTATTRSQQGIPGNAPLPPGTGLIPESERSVATRAPPASADTDGIDWDTVAWVGIGFAVLLLTIIVIDAIRHRDDRMPVTTFKHEEVQVESVGQAMPPTEDQMRIKALEAENAELRARLEDLEPIMREAYRLASERLRRERP